MLERDKITVKERAQQIHSFEGLRKHRNIGPTDIDMYYDFNGNAAIYGEGKMIGKDVSIGQRSSFENQHAAYQKAGIGHMFIIYEHETRSDEIVVVKDCIVREYLLNGRWRQPPRPTTVDEIVDYGIKYWHSKGIIL